MQNLTIVEKEAIDFAENLFWGSYDNSRTKLKEAIESHIYTYTRYTDKYSFLNILRVKIEEDKAEHKTECQKVPCRYEEERDLGIYAVDELIHEVHPFLEKKDSDMFSPEEQSNLYKQIIVLLDEVKKSNAGQEVLYNEINELKDIISLGKKTFGQVVVGKLVELTATGVVDKAFVDKVAESLLSTGKTYLNKLIN